MQDGDRERLLVTRRLVDALRARSTRAIEESRDRIQRAKLLLVREYRLRAGQQGAPGLERAVLERWEQIAARFHRTGEVAELLGAVLDAATAVTETDRGNLQLLDARSQALKIVVQRGFGAEFLEFFDSVSDGGSACGVARLEGRPIVVTDVVNDPLFAGQRAGLILRRARVAAVQSTPLLTPSRRVIGVLSTHHGSPHRVAPRRLWIVDLIAQRTADLLAVQPGFPPRAARHPGSPRATVAIE
jgi:hypothetical protein